MLWILFFVALLAYGVFSYMLLKVAYESGHEGDLTRPVGVAYMMVSGFFWLASFVLMILLHTGP